jgi:hypothetical protein
MPVGHFEFNGIRDDSRTSREMNASAGVNSFSAQPIAKLEVEPLVTSLRIEPDTLRMTVKLRSIQTLDRSDTALITPAQLDAC